MDHQSTKSASAAGDRALPEALLAFGKRIPRETFFPVTETGANEFALANPFAFLLACCLDRQTVSEHIWTIPLALSRHWGHLDPARIASMDLGVIAHAYASIPRRPRFVNAAPATTRELAHIVTREFGGDASRIWSGNRAASVRATVRRVHGVGPALANLTVLLIERAFDKRFVDREAMDIKPDVHTIRVLYRLGVSGAPTVAAALAATRTLHPANPGAMDGPLWVIGREWCKAQVPLCSSCIVTEHCAHHDLPGSVRSQGGCS